MSSSHQEHLATLIRHREKEELKKFFESQNISNLEDGLKLYYIKFLAISDNLAMAQIFIDRWELSSPNLLGEVFFLSGDINKALDLIPEITNNYLAADIYLANDKYEEVLKILNQEEISAKWYYYNGRAYSHLNKLSQADTCLEKSFDLYYEEQDIVMLSVVLSNIVVLKSRKQENNLSLSFSKQLSKLLINSKFKGYPELKAKLLINQGLFLGNLGYSAQAIKNLIKAKLVLDKYRNNHDFIRVNLSYAYNIMELGHVKKAIEILLSISPIKAFQKFDKHRYLMKGYALLENKEKYYLNLELAKEHQDPEDSFDLIHLEIDQQECELYLYQNMPEIDKIQDLTNQHDDLESWYYANNKFNFLTLNSFNLNPCFDYHQQNKHFKELNKDKILLSFQFYQDNEYAKAIDLLKEVPNQISPQIFEFKEFLIQFFQIQMNPTLRLDITNDFKSPSLKILANYINNKNISHTNAKDSVILFNKLSSFEKYYLTKLCYLLRIDLFETQTILKEGKEVEYHQIEILEAQLNEKNSLINFKTEQVHVNGKENHKFFNSEQQVRLFKFLIDNQSEFMTKESIINHVFEKKQYDPITDDNLIYVNINRLKKSLGLKDIITVKNGCYKVNLKNICILR